MRNIFELSNDFYKSLGLEDMEMCYDTPCGTEDTVENHECVANNPMIEKPDWDVVCHASAWDMYHDAKDDYRYTVLGKLGKQKTKVKLEKVSEQLG